MAEHIFVHDLETTTNSLSQGEGRGEGATLLGGRLFKYHTGSPQSAALKLGEPGHYVRGSLAAVGSSAATAFQARLQKYASPEHPLEERTCEVVTEQGRRVNAIVMHQPLPPSLPI